MKRGNLERGYSIGRIRILGNVNESVKVRSRPRCKSASTILVASLCTELSVARAACLRNSQLPPQQQARQGVRGMGLCQVPVLATRWAGVEEYDARRRPTSSGNRRMRALWTSLLNPCHAAPFRRPSQLQATTTTPPQWSGLASQRENGWINFARCRSLPPPPPPPPQMRECACDLQHARACSRTARHVRSLASIGCEAAH